VRIPPGAVGFERRALAAAVDPVPVAAGPRGVPGVEVGWRLLRDDHGHIVRELGVQGLRCALDRRAALDVDRDHLGERVHAGVGAARHCERRPDREDAFQGLLERTLHRSQPRLCGPAAKGGAVVLER